MDPVARFLLAVAVILMSCHLLGGLCRLIRQPPVIGEIIGGLALGPSVLGLVWPAAWEWLFPPETLGPVALAGQLGLVIFMFLLGCDLRIDRAGSGVRAAGLVVTGATVPPLLAGVAIAASTEPLMSGAGARPVTHSIFFGLALAITAVPVLARILIDLGLNGTPVANVALTAAVVGDGMAWAALAVILAATGRAGAVEVTVHIAAATGLMVVTVLGVRPLLGLLARWSQHNQRVAEVTAPTLIAAAIGFAAVTQLLGLHPVIGAFLFGAVVPRGVRLVERLDRHLGGFTLAVLLPLFFAGIGMKTSVGLLGGNGGHWLVFAAVLVLGVTTKIGGAAAAAHIGGFPPRQALRLGVLMNCRGVTELVVASIGYQAGLINALGLTMLVLMALATTVITGPLVRLTAGHRRPSTEDATPRLPVGRSGHD